MYLLRRWTIGYLPQTGYRLGSYTGAYPVHNLLQWFWMSEAIAFASDTLTQWLGYGSMKQAFWKFENLEVRGNNLLCLYRSTIHFDCVWAQANKHQYNNLVEFRGFMWLVDMHVWAKFYDCNLNSEALIWFSRLQLKWNSNQVFSSFIYAW